MNSGLLNIIYTVKGFFAIRHEKKRKIRTRWDKCVQVTKICPPFSQPQQSTFFLVQYVECHFTILNPVNPTHTHTHTHTHTQTHHTHTMSPFLWADLTALALSVMELHPANPCRSATGAIPMESQTFQAFVKAGPTGVSSPLYALTLNTAIRFTTAHYCCAAGLIRLTIKW